MLASIEASSDGQLPVVRTDRTGRPFLIRHLRADDVPALESFYLEFEPKRAAQGLPPEGLDRIRRWLLPVLGQGLHLVAERDTDLIGHSLLVPTSDPGTYEYAVFLRADERGLGLGTALNLASVDAARAAAVRRLWLSVEPRNRAAIRSYENAGFRFRPGTVYSTEMEMEMHLAP